MEAISELSLNQSPWCAEKNEFCGSPRCEDGAVAMGILCKGSPSDRAVAKKEAEKFVRRMRKKSKGRIDSFLRKLTAQPLQRAPSSGSSGSGSRSSGKPLKAGARGNSDPVQDAEVWDLEKELIQTKLKLALKAEENDALTNGVAVLNKKFEDCIAHSQALEMKLVEAKMENIKLMEMLVNLGAFDSEESEGVVLDTKSALPRRRLKRPRFPHAPSVIYGPEKLQPRLRLKRCLSSTA